MTTIDKHKFNLETPCLVLDMDVLERNLLKMQATIDLAVNFTDQKPFGMNRQLAFNILDGIVV